MVTLVHDEVDLPCDEFQLRQAAKPDESKKSTAEKNQDGESQHNIQQQDGASKRKQPELSNEEDLPRKKVVKKKVKAKA